MSGVHLPENRTCKAEAFLNAQLTKRANVVKQGNIRVD
jgi:hypothetical protein